MRRTFIAPLLALCLFATGCMAGNLVLSQDLALDYPEPELISHTSTTLIFKYEDWALSHEIVDAETFYPGVDLSGQAEQFIRHVICLRGAAYNMTLEFKMAAQSV
ncbi:hypothetical protein [Marinobacter sp.]|jgi:hypothetical protein|uniref:hypothetical protein n=1 Tax=Marinobacter sp. TaxID=50741 RepID=UPI001983BD1A|nr:hypothetical protein [Marinobacter sp.]MBC7192066.1 hypothetical protein [Marinobacter sp.]